jgi:hypothetical protein
MRGGGGRYIANALLSSVLIVVGLIVNAGICGAISGTHTRYQAWIIWIALIAACMLETAVPMVATLLTPSA